MVLTLRYNDLVQASQQANNLRNRLNDYANGLRRDVVNRLNSARGGGASGHLGSAVSSVNQKINQLERRSNDASEIARRISNLEQTARNADRAVVAMFRPPAARLGSRILGFAARFGSRVLRVGAAVVGGLFLGKALGTLVLGAFLVEGLRAAGGFLRDLGRSIADWYRNSAPEWLRSIGGFLYDAGRILLIVVGVVLAVVAIVALAKIALPLLLKAGVALKIKGAAGAAAKVAAGAAAKKAKTTAALTAAKAKAAKGGLGAKITYGIKKFGASKGFGIMKNISTVKKGIDGALHLAYRIHGNSDWKKTSNIIRNIGGPDNRITNNIANIFDFSFAVMGLIMLPVSFVNLRGDISNFGKLGEDATRFERISAGVGIFTGGLSIADTIRTEVGLCFDPKNRFTTVSAGINLVDGFRRPPIVVSLPPNISNIGHTNFNVANITVPNIANIGMPNFNFVMPSINIAVPQINVSIPHINIAIPQINITIPRIVVNVPPINIFIPKFQGPIIAVPRNPIPERLLEFVNANAAA